VIKSKTVYLLTKEEVETHQISSTLSTGNPFYDFLKAELDVDSEKMLDCRKIDIAENIQTLWYITADKLGIDSVSVSMCLLSVGPKVNKDLKDNEICIYEGFICDNEE